MKQYLNLLDSILNNGVKTGDRTGTGTMTLSGHHYTCKLTKKDDLIHDFPLLTTKFVSLKSVFEELMWKLNGDTNIRYLIKKNNHIWTEWPFKHWLQATDQFDSITMWTDNKKSAYTQEWKTKKKEFETKILQDDVFCKRWGSLGRTYGHQFRNFGEVCLSDISNEVKKKYFKEGYNDDTEILINGEDQLMNVIDLIHNNPENRRIIISLWNPKDTKKTLLPPCPTFYQFFANQDGYLHLNMYQRSADTFLGVPYNTAQDALLLCLMASVAGKKPSIFNYFFGDAHIYLNHINQAKEQINRTTKELPKLWINPKIKNILDFEWGKDIKLIDYNYDKNPIKGAVSI